MADEKSKIPRIFKEMLAGAVDVHLLLYAVPTTVRIGRSPEGRCHKDADLTSYLSGALVGMGAIIAEGTAYASMVEDIRNISDVFIATNAFSFAYEVARYCGRKIRGYTIRPRAPNGNKSDKEE